MMIKQTDFQVPGFGELEQGPITTPGYGEALLSLSPTAYWSLGEDTGTVLADATGNHPLVLSGDYTLGRPSAQPSADDGALRVFDGRAQASGALLPTTPLSAFSIVFWVRRVTPGTTDRFMGQYLGGVPGRTVLLMLADGRLLLGVQGDTSFASSSTNVDQWTHGVITRDAAGNAHWYLNGQPDTATTGQTNAIADQAFSLGRQTSTSFEVELDEVAVYAHVLSPDDVAWLYRTATDQPAPPPGVH